MAMNPIFRAFVQGQALIYRLSGGKLATTMMGSPVIILTTRGRKSGAVRHAPVARLIEGDAMYVIASLGGAPKNPGWYHNLKSNPDVEVQNGPDRYKARATVLEEPERTHVWERVVAVMPNFAEYQKKTSRVIPVVKLTRAT
jgi:deazaflavin-dependent oxidoreductase (nitroreductase family)